jgi:putative ABC transport system substrate-binding protein
MHAQDDEGAVACGGETRGCFAYTSVRMKRTSSRVFATRRVVLIALLAWLLAFQSGTVRSQTMTSPARIGYLTSQRPDFFFESFRARMSALGYIEGKNLSLDVRHLDGKLSLAAKLVSELARFNPDVVVLPNVASMNAARKLGLSLPFVVVSSIDPVAAGFASSLARPAGNFTGIANLQRYLSAKRLEVVKEVLPGVSGIAVLWDKNGPGPIVAAKAYKEAADALKLRVESIPIHGPEPDLESAFQRAARKEADVIVIVSNPMLGAHRAAIASLARQYRLPLVGEHGYWADSGALLTFGANLPAIGERLADFAHRIVQGAKPADLPFEQPTRFDLVVNVKTAKALGITIPQPVLARADKVIE